jgi:hypothetical protein
MIMSGSHVMQLQTGCRNMSRLWPQVGFRINAIQFLPFEFWLACQQAAMNEGLAFLLAIPMPDPWIIKNL